jgi:hypothetical protein
LFWWPAFVEHLKDHCYEAITSACTLHTKAELTGGSILRVGNCVGVAFQYEFRGSVRVSMFFGTVTHFIAVRVQGGSDTTMPASTSLAQAAAATVGLNIPQLSASRCMQWHVCTCGRAFCSLN